nr:hypothetical protein GCM10017745_01620 [Saccharothrix mutabilis subsp. capreolus]
MREGQGEGGLAGAGLAFAQQRPAQAQREEGGHRDPRVGQVADPVQPSGQCLGRVDGGGGFGGHRSTLARRPGSPRGEPRGCFQGASPMCGKPLTSTIEL